MTDTVTLDGKEIVVGDAHQFGINEVALDQEMSQAGVTLRFYGSLAAELSAQASTFKARVDFKYAEVSSQVRAAAKVAGDRITEAIVKERVLEDVEYQGLVALHLQMERDYRKVENMYRILLKRCDLMTALSYKQRVEIQKNAF